MEDSGGKHPFCRIISRLNPSVAIREGSWSNSAIRLRDAYPDEPSGGMKQRVKSPGPVHPARPLVDEPFKIPGPSFEAELRSLLPAEHSRRSLPLRWLRTIQGGRTPRRSGDLAFPARPNKVQRLP